MPPTATRGRPRAAGGVSGSQAPKLRFNVNKNIFKNPKGAIVPQLYKWLLYTYILHSTQTQTSNFKVLFHK